jgi:hypothetical protein
MPRYYVKISGSIWNMKAESRTDAEQQASKLPCLGAYCSVQALEIGKDVDELGWPIPKGHKPTCPAAICCATHEYSHVAGECNCGYSKVVEAR